MLNLNFTEKSLGLVSLPHFVYDVSRKMFLKLYSINVPNLRLGRYWAICVLQFIVNQAVTP